MISQLSSPKFFSGLHNPIVQTAVNVGFMTALNAIRAAGASTTQESNIPFNFNFDFSIIEKSIFYERTLLDFLKFEDWFDFCKKTESEACLQDPIKRTLVLNTIKNKMNTVLSSNATEMADTLIPDCFSATDCPDINLTKVCKKDHQATQTVFTSMPVNSTREFFLNWMKSHFFSPEWNDVQEILRFRNDDPREKLLFLAAEYDQNGAVEPETNSAVLSKLSYKFDIKYRVVKSYEEICKTIESAKKTNNLGYVVINAHGDPSWIVLDKKNSNNFAAIHQNLDFGHCFSGLKPYGKILLMSCSAAKGTNHIAQKLAEGAKRTVIAPRDLLYPAFTSVLSADEAVLYHPENRLYSFLPFYNVNLFTTIRPTFKNCSRIDIKNTHPRESEAAQIIKDDLVSKSLLQHNSSNLGEEYLELCKDDPRDKFLFLSGEFDKNGASNPVEITNILSVFGNKFDLQYKVVKSFKEICQEISKAAKMGKLNTVMIQAHGNSTHGMVLSRVNADNENRMSPNEAFAPCFSGIEKEGTIIFMGSSLGKQNIQNETVAQKIADKVQRTVIATSCHVYPNDVRVQSINPLLIAHEGYSRLMNYVYHKCTDNGDNLFKTFTPKTQP
jgi:hypothetical protein